MSGRSCSTCHYDDHHAPDCPETRWADGHPRGTVHEVERRPTLPAIQAVKVRVFVPAAVAATESLARGGATLFAYLACQLATPVVESAIAIEGGHIVTIAEKGDVAARAAALLEKG